jgi:hypothetical protein
MAEGFRQAFEEGAASVVVIGTDGKSSSQQHSG